MRKLILVSFIGLGATASLFSALGDDWSVKFVMMTIGAVVGAVLGGALTSIGRRSRSRRAVEADEELDLTRRRDKGGSPFMKPWNAEIDHHMFDPDRHD